MTAPETTVTVIVEKPGPRFHASANVQRDNGPNVDSQSYHAMVATLAEARTWVRNIARMAGAPTFQFIDRSRTTKPN